MPAAILLVTALLIPAPAGAASEHPGPPTTTTTVPESTTTTRADESTTTTTIPATTTTGQSPTTTTAPGATSTTPPEDPLEADDADEIEELPLPSIRFPIVGRASYRDTYGAPRDGGARLHNGTDIFAEKGTPVVAVANGVVERMGETEDAGLFVVVRHSDGWRSVYVHLDNDSPGTDNGLSVHYGPGIRVGARLAAGTIVGYVGDSGNSEDSAPHLHFELHQPDGHRPNPYPALRSARRSSSTSTLATVDYRDLVAENAEMIGHLDPGTGFNADIAVVDGHAYIGTSGARDRCPGTGIRIIDVSTPDQPALVTSFADHTTFPGTATGSVWVGNVATEGFAGRLGIVGLQDCDNPLSTEDHIAGFAVYDLDDPAAPRLLAIHPTLGKGVMGLDVISFDGAITLGAIIPTVRPNTNAPSDLVGIFDLTEPSAPRMVSVWAPDISDRSQPDQPAWVGDVVFWTGPSSLTARVAPEGLFEIDVSRPEEPQGHLLPVEDSPFDTESPDEDTEPAGYFIEHRTLPYGSDAELVIALSSGIRLVDLTDRSEPVDVARFVPAPAFDPQHWWTAPDGGTRFAMVWDADIENGYLYLTDVHSGLWVVELTTVFGTPPEDGEID